ncbi:AAA family ATPase [Streptomyces avicenniae]|uniref:AAA family ATPase n=1 Tax=Streptomyces avicenniae TaxID=500153 RepID=UPI00167D022C|nr:AAA family ATPase [Streptomyces avicenniae]
MTSPSDPFRIQQGLKYLRLHITNFLSYQSAVLDLADLVALVGPNATGKSNAVAAIKLLREIPIHGLPIAIARRGGFDQLRHRSSGRPYNPALRLDFQFDNEPISYYELKLRGLEGKRYEVKQERGSIFLRGDRYTFINKGGELTYNEKEEGGAVHTNGDRKIPVPVGQSAVSFPATFGIYIVTRILQLMQTVEINPALVGELQEPSSTREFEPDGSNAASMFEELNSETRSELVDELAAIVPGIRRIELRRLADKVTLAFVQEVSQGKRREFLAKQMSDGTLRAFSILLSMLQENRPALLVIEEPEIAIHLGALRTLVDIFRQQSESTQVLITTHSADIVDTIDIDALRVVWTEDGASRIAPVAEHTREPVRQGLITPGQLLRSDSLDPELS